MTLMSSIPSNKYIFKFMDQISKKNPSFFADSKIIIINNDIDDDLTLY